MSEKRNFRYYEEIVEMCLKATNACMLILDTDKMKYVYCANTENVFGLNAKELMDEISCYANLEPEEYALSVSRYFTHPDDWCQRGMSFTKALKGEQTSYEARLRSSVTNYKWCKIKLYPHFVDNCLKEVIVLCYDIDELKKAQFKIDRIEGVDEFTGGFNKVKFFSELRSFLDNNSCGNHALILLDLDNFKEVNDPYGHAHGDLVLLGVAREMIALAKKYGGYFGRFGGDEFVVFLPDYRKLSLLKKILSGLVSFDIEGVKVSASVGAALYESDNKSAEELFLMADTALYNAKDLGKARYSFYCETGFEIRKIT